MVQKPLRPFFIVGQARSGTTLLRYILSSHPHLYVTAETGFIPFLGIASRRELHLKDVEKVMRRIENLNTWWQGLISDAEAFHASLPVPTLDYFLDELYRRQIARKLPNQEIADSRSVRWGDKTPGYINYIPEVATIFPAAQFIHIIRDGRDSTLSARQKWSDRQWYMDDYYLLKQWVRSLHAGRKAGERLGPDRYLEVHYERLVQEPEQELQRVCAFLQEPYLPLLLDHTPLARKIGVGVHQAVRKPITSRSVDRWRGEMSPFAKKLANRIAGSTLTSAGYQLAEGPPLTVAEWWRWLWLALKFTVVDLTRRFLYRIGVLTLNRGKRR